MEEDDEEEGLEDEEEGLEDEEGWLVAELCWEELESPLADELVTGSLEEEAGSLEGDEPELSVELPGVTDFPEDDAAGPQERSIPDSARKRKGL